MSAKKGSGPHRRPSYRELLLRVEALERGGKLVEADIVPGVTYFVEIPKEAERKPVRVTARLLVEEPKNGSWVRCETRFELERTDLQGKAQGPKIVRKAEDIFRAPG